MSLNGTEGSEMEAAEITEHGRKDDTEIRRRKARTGEEAVLFLLADRQNDTNPTPIEIEDGKTLIAGLLLDKKAESNPPSHESLDPLEELETPEALEMIQGVLEKVRKHVRHGEPGEFSLREIRIARAFFKMRSAQWKEDPGDELPFFAARNSEVYKVVLGALNKNMPVPESVQADPSTESDFHDIDAILDPLLEAPDADGNRKAKDALEPEHVLACYTAIKRDIDNNPVRAGIIEDAVAKAHAYVSQVELGKRVVVVTIKPDGKTADDVEVKLHEKGGKYQQQTADGSSQFVLDLTQSGFYRDDNEYVQALHDYGNRVASAKRAVAAIPGLMERAPHIEPEEVSNVSIFQERLSQMAEGLTDENQRAAVRNLVALVDTQLLTARGYQTPDRMVN